MRFDDGTEDIQKYTNIRYVEQLQIYMDSHEDDEDIKKMMANRVNTSVLMRLEVQ